MAASYEPDQENNNNKSSRISPQKPFHFIIPPHYPFLPVIPMPSPARINLHSSLLNRPSKRFQRRVSRSITSDPTTVKWYTPSGSLIPLPATRNKQKHAWRRPLLTSQPTSKSATETSSLKSTNRSISQQQGRARRADKLIVRTRGKIANDCCNIRYVCLFAKKKKKKATKKQHFLFFFSLTLACPSFIKHHFSRVLHSLLPSHRLSYSFPATTLTCSIRVLIQRRHAPRGHRVYYNSHTGASASTLRRTTIGSTSPRSNHHAPRKLEFSEHKLRIIRTKKRQKKEGSKKKTKNHA